MLLESVAYTATLVDYISRLTLCPVATVTRVVGQEGIQRICHNAPMSRHLPITRIVDEVLYDYGLPCKKAVKAVEPDFGFGKQIMNDVEKTGCKHQEYATELYTRLLLIAE